MGSEPKAVVPGMGGGEEKQGSTGRRGTCARKGSCYLAQRILIRERWDQRKSCSGKLSFFFFFSAKRIA